MTFLVAISIGPVQEFIAAARRTSDLWAGSQLLVDLAKTVALSLEQQDAILIFPADAQGDGPNKIVARLEAADVSAVAQSVKNAKNAAREAFYRRFQSALQQLSSRQRELVDIKRADVQLDHFLELFAAWVPLGDDYQAARQNVDRLLAGRKALRDFSGASQNDVGVPKSSLDPSRAGVLRRFVEGVSDQHPLNLKRSEVLDAVSLLKRIEGKTRGVRVLDTTSAALRATECSVWCPDETVETVQPPVPYYAVLLADGDEMGERIKQNKNSDEDITFSRLLSGFAASVNSIVRQHDGFLIYAGGDDVLAIVPVVTAIQCARELAESFKGHIGETLSCGVAIVHHKEPLNRALDQARAAERAAKIDRDSLAVALHTRGGAPLTVPAPWKAERDDWDTWIEHLRSGNLSRGAAYELVQLARQWPAQLSNERLGGEARRIWKRKVEGPLLLPDYATCSAKELLTFAHKLTIARFLSVKSVKEVPI